MGWVNGKIKDPRSGGNCGFKRINKTTTGNKTRNDPKKRPHKQRQ